MEYKVMKQNLLSDNNEALISKQDEVKRIICNHISKRLKGLARSLDLIYTKVLTWSKEMKFKSVLNVKSWRLESGSLLEDNEEI